jgi:hypothetical protein
MMQVSEVRRRMEQQAVLRWVLGRRPSRGKIVADEDQDEVRLAGRATCRVLALA